MRVGVGEVLIICKSLSGGRGGGGKLEEGWVYY